MKKLKKEPRRKNNRITDPLKKDLTSLFYQKGWEKVRFELKPKNKSITLRLSEEMLEAIKSRASNEGLDYQKWIRSSIEEALNKVS